MLGSTVWGCRTTWLVLSFVAATCLLFQSPPLLPGLFLSYSCFVGDLAASLAGALAPYATLSQPALTFALGTTFLLEATFWSCNAVLGLIYYFDPALLKPYKLHEDKFPPAELIRSCLADVVIGHAVVRPPLLYLTHSLFLRFGMSASPSEIPPLATIYLQLFASILVDDTLFYWSHRMLHHPAIYKHIHKQHHTFK
jgi:sterol desaturase/sphingolipid hydroxylase (fatty acid hydroxylase superfamily)